MMLVACVPQGPGLTCVAGCKVTVVAVVAIVSIVTAVNIVTIMVVVAVVVAVIVARCSTVVGGGCIPRVVTGRGKARVAKLLSLAAASAVGIEAGASAPQTRRCR